MIFAPSKGISSVCVEILSLVIDGAVVLEVGGGLDEMTMAGGVEHHIIVDTDNE